MSPAQQQIARMTAAAEQAASLGPLERVTSTAALILVSVAVHAMAVGTLDRAAEPPEMHIERMMGAGMAQA
jgi:hypothetical protein